MRLSSVAFRSAFRRFQSIHQREDRHRLDSFRNPRSYVYRAEDYKEGIARHARELLGANRWKRRQIGDGYILRAVIAAIEQPDNNLVEWSARWGEARRVHVRLHDALSGRGPRKEFEQIFFELYAGPGSSQHLFEHLMHLCGRRYELLGYLFFIADRHEFLPIRTKSFDQAFRELGLPLQTERACSWENYHDYLETMHLVREALHAEGIGDATLLDAHSFCWLLATYGRKRDHYRRPPQFRGRMEEFTGTMVVHVEAPISGDDESEDLTDDTVVDMDGRSAGWAAAGRVAEEIALAEERRRLEHAGRSDLAEQVKSVSNRPQLGYDIRSFETSGDRRHIEVKSMGNQRTFFLSRNEWRKSRSLKNYWFYLVTSNSVRRPRITLLAASQLEEQHLTPTQYLVRTAR